MGMTANLEALLAKGHDSASLRFALATRYLADNDIERALEHAKFAVRLDADYSAAWKLLGRVSVAAGLSEQAVSAYETGIGVAERRGDQQAAREMRVFLKRLDRSRT